MTKQEAAKDARLKKTYKSSLEEFNQKMVEQEYCCAICRRPFVKGAGGDFNKEIYGAFQDHYHECCPRRLKTFCGRCNRGLLCYTCNKVVVGIIEKLKVPADRLAAYMQKWSHILPRVHTIVKMARKRKKK